MNKTEAAEEIARILAVAGRMAGASAMPFLEYLIRMAEMEARKEAAK